ncbi:heme o synthase [Flexithrix dorotheae]|uniref:heme o synthase n=1 Tax=Flexithrix dorotheae TaxID=70993 RepID=UPI0003812180|nr:heme o synthase [Flexithrix dorotheae]
MITENSEIKELAIEGISWKAKQYFQLLKFRLSALVVFSGMFGYGLAQQGAFDWTRLGMFLLGSFFITGSANTINQIIEKDLDKLMARTKDRPLPTGRLSVSEAIIYSMVLAALGSALLVWFVSPLVAGLSLFSLILYAFVYTPLKQISPISVFVGAFPGAFPPLIGWVACTGSFSTEAFIIFSIQFIWQFPHFWSIAWIGFDDYDKAGFKMLPSAGGKNFKSALQIFLYTLFLIPLGILPAQYGMTGMVSAMVAIISGVFFIFLAFKLLKSGSKEAAKKIMFGSFFYLPIIQIAFLIDKI